MRHGVVCGVVAGALVAVVGPPLGAQLRTSVDVGGASVRYADSVRVTATSVAPRLRYDRGLFTGVASASVSALDASAWSTQSGLSASLLSPAFGIGRLELAAVGGGTVHQDGVRTGRYVGQVRLHATGAGRGAWVGGGVGQAWDGARARGSLEGDVGAYAQSGAFTLIGTWRPAAVGDSIRYTDLGATIQRETSRLELAASGGIRSGIAASPRSPNAWAGASAAIWVTNGLAIVADGGSYAADWAQGFPGGTYFSVALRLAAHRPIPIRASRVGSPSSRDVSSNARLEVAPVGNGRYRVRFHAPSARRVEVMGDFTEWQALEGTSAGNGWWSVVTPITPGVRQLAVRLDSGAWVVPAGATPERDEFGALVGVIVVR